MPEDSGDSGLAQALRPITDQILRMRIVLRLEGIITDDQEKFIRTGDPEFIENISEEHDEEEIEEYMERLKDLKED